MISLPAAAVIENARAAPGFAHAEKAGGDLANRGVPVDLLKRAVGPAPHRRGQPIAPVLVVVQTLRLLAGVAARRDVGAVTADPRDQAPLDLDFDSAVD